MISEVNARGNVIWSYHADSVSLERWIDDPIHPPFAIFPTESSTEIRASQLVFRLGSFAQVPRTINGVTDFVTNDEVRATFRADRIIPMNEQMTSISLVDANLRSGALSDRRTLAPEPALLNRLLAKGALPDANVIIAGKTTLISLFGRIYQYDAAAKRSTLVAANGAFVGTYGHRVFIRLKTGLWLYDPSTRRLSLAKRAYDQDVVETGQDGEHAFALFSSGLLQVFPTKRHSSITPPCVPLQVLLAWPYIVGSCATSQDAFDVFAYRLSK